MYVMCFVFPNIITGEEASMFQKKAVSIALMDLGKHIGFPCLHRCILLQLWRWGVLTEYGVSIKQTGIYTVNNILSL